MYAVRYEIYDDLSSIIDFMDPRPTRRMLGPTSPIALFALRLPRKKGEEARLRPVAIQMDYKPGEKMENI